MKCPRCTQENPPQAKFCLECAAPLALNRLLETSIAPDAAPEAHRGQEDA